MHRAAGFARQILQSTLSFIRNTVIVTDKMTTSYIAKDFKIHLPADLTEKQLNKFPAYKTWITALGKTLALQKSSEHPFHANPYTLRSITVQAVDRFEGGRLGFLKLTADIRTKDDQALPSSVFLRGGSVAMLLVLRPEGATSDDDSFVILTNQPRVPAGTFSFTEIPAGMLDDSGTFSGAAAKEIQEETGLTIEENELIDLTQLTTQSAAEDDEYSQDDVLQRAIYPSPGGSDEFIPVFLARKTLPRSEIDKLQGKLTGVREYGEMITLKLVRLKAAWKVAGRDAKTLSALCLYDGLRREGKL